MSVSVSESELYYSSSNLKVIVAYSLSLTRSFSSSRFIRLLLLAQRPLIRVMMPSSLASSSLQVYKVTRSRLQGYASLTGATGTASHGGRMALSVTMVEMALPVTVVEMALPVTMVEMAGATESES